LAVARETFGAWLLLLGLVGAPRDGGLGLYSPQGGLKKEGEGFVEDSIDGGERKARLPF